MEQKVNLKIDNVGSQIIRMNIARFRELADEITDLYAKKNVDYNNSFADTLIYYKGKYGKHGYISALTRLHDKLQRAEHLLLSDKERQVNDETIVDTLKDLASYALMLVMEVE